VICNRQSAQFPSWPVDKPNVWGSRNNHNYKAIYISPTNTIQRKTKKSVAIPLFPFSFEANHKKLITVSEDNLPQVNNEPDPFAPIKIQKEKTTTDKSKRKKPKETPKHRSKPVRFFKLLVQIEFYY
jgi:hypothetical protein